MEVYDVLGRHTTDRLNLLSHLYLIPPATLQDAAEAIIQADLDYHDGAHLSTLLDVFGRRGFVRSEEHTSELQSRGHLVCRLLLEKKKYHIINELVTGSVTIIDNLEQYNNVFTILAINNHIDRRAVGDEKIF